MGRIGECGSMCGLSGYFYGMGFNLVVLPLGIPLSIALKMFGNSMVVHTFSLATMLTIMMLVVAVLKRDKTVDNAVDSPVRMYLDFINLFVRVIGSKIRR